MKRTHWLFASLLACSAAHPASAVTGPLISGPENVYDAYTLNLDPGTATSGSWTIDWGDGTAALVVPVSQLTAAHTYPSTGSYEINAVLRNSSGVLVDSQVSYRELVRKTGPLIHYNFEDSSGSQHIGPAIVNQGTVTAVPSFSASTGNAIRLAGGSYLSIPTQQMKDADFFGLEFWIKPTNLTTKQMIYAGVGNGNGNVLVYIENNNLCFELTGSGVVKSVPLGYGVEAGRWYQFAVSYERSPYFGDRNSLRFYRDGFLLKEDSYSSAQSIPINRTGATIGAYNTGSVVAPVPMYPLSADLDEIVLHPLGVFPGALLERYRAATSNRSVLRVASGADGAAPFTVVQPVITQEVTVGLDSNPTVDNAPRIRTAIAAATAGTRIKLVDQTTGQGGGTYYLRSGQSGTFSGRLMFLNDKTDIELDGNGVKFMVTAFETRYIEVMGATRVAVKNMSFDIDPTKWRVGMYGQIQSVDATTGKVVVRWVKGAANTPDPIPTALNTNGFWRWRRVSGTTRQNISGVREWSFSSRTPDPSDASLWTLTFNPTEHPPTNWIWAEFNTMQSAGDLIQVNNARFTSTGLYTERCWHVSFDNVNFHGVAGMAVLNEKSDYVKMTNSRIGLPIGESAFDRPFATGSDGFHFHNSRAGHLQFENNDIGMTDDDPVSLKDQVVMGVEKVAANQLKSDALATGAIELRQNNLLPLSPPFNAVITSYNATTDVATLDRDAPGNIGDKFTLLKSYQYSGNYIVRGNNIHDLNGRMMIYAPDGTIANNRISNMYFHIGFSAANFEGSGEPYNIVLANNLLKSTGTGDAAVWGQNPPSPVIDDLGFTNNSFLGASWAINYSASPNFINNYTEKVTGTAGQGIMHFANHTKFGTAFGNIHYNPLNPLFATKDAGSDFTAGANELIPARSAAADVIVDNTSATYTGTWGTSSFNVGQFYGTDYRWSNTANSTVQFTPTIPTTGTYRVYAMWNGGTDRGSTVPYTITHAGGTSTVNRSQRTGGGLWAYLGTYTFNAGTAGNVKASITGANGLIIADAVRFQQ